MPSREAPLLDVITLTAPVFLIIGLGYIASRGGLVSREQVRGIGVFVLNFALPALVIKALAERPIGEVFNPWYLLAYGLGSLGVFGLGLAYFRFVRGRGLADAAIAGLGMSASNSGFVGYPVVVMVAGPTAVLGLALNMVVENLLMIPWRWPWPSRRSSAGRAVEHLARHPRAPGAQPADPGDAGGCRPVAAGAAPASRAGEGGGHAGDGLGAGRALRHRRHPAWRAPGRPAAGHGGHQPGQAGPAPAGGGGVVLLLPPVDPLLRVTGILFACAPMMSIYPLVGMRFGLEARCAATLVMATVLSFFGLSLAIALLQR